MNMAIAGFLPVAIVRYVERTRRRRVGTDLLLAAFFLSVAAVAVVSVPNSASSAAIGGAAAVLGVGFAAHCRVGGRWRRFRAVSPAVPIAGVAWIALLAVGFPDPAGDGQVVNVYVHFVGYALGFTAAYLAHGWRLFDAASKKKGSAVGPETE